jgi:hypothetical protein
MTGIVLVPPVAFCARRRKIAALPSPYDAGCEQPARRISLMGHCRLKEADWEYLRTAARLAPLLPDAGLW